MAKLKKLTEAQEIKRAEDIHDALYAAREANNVAQLVTYTPYIDDRGRPTERPELMVLAEAMRKRATKMLLKAFDGRLDGKKFPKPKKMPL
jgi:hypothetical protein